MPAPRKKKPNTTYSEINNEISKKKPHTRIQLNTMDTIHHILEEYDDLVIQSKFNPASYKIKEKIEDYTLKLTSPYALAESVLDYNISKGITDAYKANGRIRELINSALETGELILDADGLIRNPKTIPYENISASGNIATIMLPPKYTDELISFLQETLIDESIRMFIPCNNMIIVIEIGDYGFSESNDLYKKLQKPIGLFALKYNMTIPVPVTPSHMFHLSI